MLTAAKYKHAACVYLQCIGREWDSVGIGKLMLQQQLHGEERFQVTDHDDESTGVCYMDAEHACMMLWQSCWAHRVGVCCCLHSRRLFNAPLGALRGPRVHASVRARVVLAQMDVVLVLDAPSDLSSLLFKVRGRSWTAHAGCAWSGVRTSVGSSTPLSPGELGMCLQGPEPCLTLGLFGICQLVVACMLVSAQSGTYMPTSLPAAWPGLAL